MGSKYENNDYNGNLENLKHFLFDYELLNDSPSNSVNYDVVVEIPATDIINYNLGNSGSRAI